TTHRVCAARKRRSFMRVMRLRKSTCPAPSAPCTWNTCFAMSKPIVVACSMDASFGGCSTPSPWHTDAVGGRPPHHPTQPVSQPSAKVGNEGQLRSCANLAAVVASSRRMVSKQTRRPEYGPAAVAVGLLSFLHDQLLDRRMRGVSLG